MKKRIILFCLIVLGSNVLFSEGYSAGVKAGMNLATIWGDDANVGNVAPGFTPKFTGGIFLGYNLSEKVTLGYELLYSQKGADYSNGSPMLTYSYVDLPVYLSVEVIDKLSLDIGGYMSFLIDAEANYGSRSLDLKLTTSGLDFGPLFGVSYGLTKNIEVETRFSLGMANLSSHGSLDTKNMCIQFLISYSFL